jgi:hypothetical protein
VSNTAERIAAAKARDEEGIEQDETEGAPFEAPEAVAESEPPPPEPEPEPSPEPEPLPPAAALDAEQAAELEKATAAYLKRVEKVFGPGDVPPACPACEGLGFDLTGGEPAPVLLAHENFRRCDECDGYGLVRTGSHVPGHDLNACPNCVGRGYLERLPTPQAVPDQAAEYGTPAWMGNVSPGTAQ